MSSPCIRVAPDSIHFRDVKKGETDSVEVWATNTGRSPIGIRFSLPLNSPFILIPGQQALIPPGLDTKCTIKYTAKDEKRCDSELIIGCSKCQVKVPITASPPCARIISDMNTINIGTVCAQVPYKFTFSLTNIGVKEGSFTLRTNNQDIELNPHTGTILPSKTFEISAILTPKEEGNIDFEIRPDFHSDAEQVPFIKVLGKSVQNTLSIFIEGKEVKEIDFKTIFYGQKKIIRATIMNNGPAKRSFVVLNPHDLIEGKEGSSYVPKEEEDEESQLFTAVPSEGMIEPYGKINVDFAFIPPEPKGPIIDDLDQSFSQVSTIEVVETQQHIEFALSGKAVHQFLQLSSYDFFFDKQEIGEKESRKLVLTNNSHFLPVEFKIKPIAHFRFEPSSGTIPINSKKEVQIVFFPKNYGVYNFTTNIIICKGLSKKTINLTAECCQITDHPFKRVPIWETQKTAKYNAYHPDRRYSNGIEGIQRKSQLREKFDGYITDYAQKRETRSELLRTRAKSVQEAEKYLTQTRGTYTKEDVDDYIQSHQKPKDSVLTDPDLGIDSFEGLEPPCPPIRNTPAPLFVADPQRFGLATAPASNIQSTNGRSRKVFTDDNILIKKKFKAKPTTPAEVNECGRPLTPAQQLMVVPSHQTLNFGQVSVYSTSVKSFNITNNLQQHIFVTMNYEFDELSKSSPSSQIVLPKQTAGFDIRFCSTTQKNFSKTIQYTINNIHKYSFTVNAQVVPIDLQLSRQSIEFRFSPDSISPHIKEFVIIQNKSNATAEYTWSGLTPNFTISQNSGSIEPLKSQNIEITYTPTTRAHDETTLLLNVTGGTTRTLKCIGDIGVPKCSISKKLINFGLIPIGILKTQMIKFKNTGEDDAIFTISHQNVNELQVIPMNGRIAAHEQQVLQLNFKSVHAAPFDIPVNISIAGANNLTFNVTGQSELPQVQILNQEFEFGRLFVGSSASLEGTIENVGAIPAILYLDLSNHPDFRIEYSTDLVDGEHGENENSVTLVSNPVFVTKSELKLSTYPSAATLTEKEEEPEQTGPGLVYKFYLVEKSTIKFNLVFQPTEAAEYSFELPFTLMNVISASSFHLQPIVSAESIKAPLSISTTALDFGISPLFNPLNPHYRPAIRQLTLNNEYKSNLQWRIDTSLFGNPPSFTIEPNSGTIITGASALVHISFTARAANIYNINLPVYVKTDKDKEESIVAKIQLTGVGTSNPFSISTKNVSLPIVPLGVKSQATIYVMNDAFIESTLSIQSASSENMFPVRISFPEGNKLLHTSIKIPMVVSFQSNKPMSFSTMIAVIDDQGNAASFSVSVTTDNSIFTLFPFFKGNEAAIKSQKGGPITTDIKVVEKPTELTSRFITTNDVLELKAATWEASTSKLMITFVQRYLNALLLNTQISQFPADFIRNDGALVLELISNISNGRRPGSESMSEKSKDTNSKQYTSMRRLVIFLQSLGCLISSVKPEFLLPKPEFLNIMRNKITKQLLGIDYFNAPDISTFDQTVLSEFTASKLFSNAVMQRLKVMENLYDQLSIESWMIVTMQLFKIFIVGKVEIERLQQAAGVSDAVKTINAIASRFAKMDDTVSEIVRPNKSLTSSTIFSTSECVLLKWISIHTCNMYQDLQKSINNFQALRDAVSFTALLKAHTNVLKTPLPDTVLDNDPSAADNNAINFSLALKTLKFAFCPQADEITNGSACMLAIISAYLFETLPKYLPITTVEFITPIHKIITRSVNIQNPSKAEITYRAKLEGSHDFSLNNDSITIPPGGNIDYPITFNARTVKPQAGRLVLSPLKPKFISGNQETSTGGVGSTTSTTPDSTRIETHIPVFSAPLVIEMISDVSLTAPDLTTTIEGEIYQTKQIQVQIKNYLGSKARVKIFTRMIQIADESGMNLPAAKNLTQQIQDFIANPEEQEEQTTERVSKSNKEPATPTAFDKLIKSHKVFCIDQDEIDFADANSTVTLNVDFVPISLGSFRCLLLFQDFNQGEFIYEIDGKSTLPTPVEAATSKFKIEAGKKMSYNISVDMMNNNLIKALAYSIEKTINVSTFVSERKFKDLLTRRVHDVETCYKQSFTQQSFTLINSSPQFFEAPAEVLVQKTSFVESIQKSQHVNYIPLTFKPVKAGEYPVKLLLNSKYDIRVFHVNAIALAEQKEFDIEFSTVCGKTIKQDIPLSNPSKEIWNFKVSLSGDSAFAVPQRAQVKPSSNGTIAVTFSPMHVGVYHTEVQVYNITKETQTVYRIVGNADEPPAERKISINCKARNKQRETIEVKPFMKQGVCQVTTTVPIISFPSEIHFENGELTEPFEITLLAQRSGLSVGTITFTDTTTKNFIWYILEVHVDSPSPEQTIPVQTAARKCVTVNIPISNTKKQEARFSVVLSDDDLFGEKQFVVPPESTANYQIVVSPLKEMQRNSSVYFYSDEDGEFWYALKISATEAPQNTIAPLSSPIGKHTSTFILLENPLSKATTVRYENSNPTAFHILAKRVIQLLPMEKKRIEVRYIPTTVGVKETADISFKSSDTGDWTYNLTGTGKPPQPLSPTIVSSPLMQTNSALVLFNNPFPYPSKFSVSMSSECEEGTFKFLLKKKTFVLQSYGEEYQIPFTFSPQKLGQFQAHIVVAFQGPSRVGTLEAGELPSIRWTFPVIGNSISLTNTDIKHLRCRAMETQNTTLNFTLVGETEVFEASEYTISLKMAAENEFLRLAVDIRPSEIHRTATSSELTANAKFSPMRPITANGTIIVKNPLGQEWEFDTSLVAERGKPIGTIQIESLLNKTGTAQIYVPAVFRAQTPFHAYLAIGSAAEFTVSADHGFIEPSIGDKTELPIHLIFSPKMYGKVLQGLLVVDTLDSQYLFDIVGKTPEYVPPVIKQGTKLFDGGPEDKSRLSSLSTTKKRNIIKENIENVKLMKARIVSPHHAAKQPFK